MVYKYIFHLSDIHIQNNQRHRPANLQAFQRTLEAIRARATPGESIAVIVGDLFHFNNRFGVNDISDAKTFLRDLAGILPVIIIPGNHDMNLNNKEDNDLVNDFIETAEIPGVFYYPFSGIYRHDNINFIHISLRDMIIPPAPDASPGQLNIALLHETIKGAKVGIDVNCGGAQVEIASVSRALNHGRFGQDLAQKYDFVLLGHIHEMQFLAPNMAYCGSLIQHDTGESLNKGFLLWDLPAKSASFIPIETDYGYLKIIARGDHCEFPEKIPKNILKTNIDYRDCSADFVQQIKEKVEAKTGISPSIVDKSIYEKVQLNENITAGLANHFDLFQKKVSSFNFPRATQDELIRLHKDNWKTLDKPPPIKWRPVSLRWDNLSCYGAGNYIDFSAIEGITGIVSDNGTGKSSLVDIIMVAIFDEGTYGQKAEEMINNKSKERGFLTEIELLAGDKKYKITRRMKSNKNKHKECTFIESSGGNVRNLTRNSSLATLKEIKGIFGNPEDYFSTTICSQFDMTNFACLTPSKRRDQIFHLFDFEAIEGIAKITKQKIRGLKDRLAELKDSAGSERGDLLEKRMEEARGRIDRIRGALEENSAKAQTLESEKEKALMDYTALSVSEETLMATERATQKELDEALGELGGRLEVDCAEDELLGKLKGVPPPNKPKQVLLKEISGLDREIRSAESNLAGAPSADASTTYSLESIRKVAPAPTLAGTRAKLDEMIAKKRRALEDFLKKVPGGSLEGLRAFIEKERAELSEDGYDEMAIRANLELERAEKLVADTRARINKIPGVAAPDKPLPSKSALEKSVGDLRAKLEELSRMDPRAGIIDENALKFSKECSACDSNRAFIRQANALASDKGRQLSDQKEAIERELDEAREMLRVRLIRDDYVELSERLRLEEAPVRSLRAKAEEAQRLKARWDTFRSAQSIIPFFESGEKFENKEGAAEITRLETMREDMNGYITKELQRDISAMVARRENLSKELERAEQYEADKRVRSCIRAIKLRTTMLSIEESLATIAKNKKAEREINRLKGELSLLQEERTRLSSELIAQEKALATAGAEREEHLRACERKKEVEGDLSLQEKYYKCVNQTDGIQGEFLELILGNLEILTNKILQGFAPFVLRFEKNQGSNFSKVATRIEHMEEGARVNFSELSQASGYQKFASGIAIKIALCLLVSRPVGDFLIIDEGFSSSDSHNRARAQDFLRELKERFRFIFIISHLDEFKNLIEFPLKITRGDGKSTIRYGDNPAVDEVKEEPPREEEIERDNIFEEGPQGITCRLCKTAFKKSSLSSHKASKRHKKLLEGMQ